MRWAIWATPTHLGEYRRAIEYQEQHLKSRARSATAWAKAMRWAIWATPTTAWASTAAPLSTMNNRLQIAREIGDRSGEASALQQRPGS